jgi:type II secretory pathway component GspD/PulD (secretin)
MTEDQSRIASFVVRFTQHLWKDQQGEPQVQWRGRIRHVQSDEEVNFSDLEKVLTFIRQHLTQLTLEAMEGKDKTEREKVLEKSFGLWEELATTYSKMVSDAMVQTFRQSESFKTDIDTAVARALQTWQSPEEYDKAAIAEAVENINIQVQALARKLEMLETVILGKGGR